ncbi:uncharacterized protein [Mytilus edulis]|uniref:uncharacterized protein n=1 Tax=Mytilus edulis TaxID=6550 RepID=UPI0039EF0F6B
MPGRLQFFVSIETKSYNGVDAASNVHRVLQFIINYTVEAKYIFRVTGEAKVIAIYEVEDDSDVNMVTSQIMQIGPFNVICTPLTSFESWGLHLGQPVVPAERKLSEKNVVWFEVSLENNDLSVGQFQDMWKQKVFTISNQRHSGYEIEIFKILGERKLYVFSCKKGSNDWESHMRQLPIEDNLYRKTKLVTQMY